jgi:hypothetical protein
MLSLVFAIKHRKARNTGRNACATRTNRGHREHRQECLCHAGDDRTPAVRGGVNAVGMKKRGEKTGNYP